MLNFSFFQPISMAYLAISGRMAPGLAGTAKQKRAIAHEERKQMAFGFTCFAQLVTPGRVIDLEMTKIAKFCLEGHIKTFYN